MIRIKKSEENMENSVHVVMNKGKKFAAGYVKSQCVSPSESQILNELLDVILDPTKTITDRETIDWCIWLIAGGRTPDDFSSTVHRYDNATTCGLVWTANFVAYRCRTCGISPCMSLCAECFQKGNHDGHDFNMFRSQAGGACDCGDPCVMKETGFCDRHGPRAQINTPPAPGDLLCVAEAMMPRIILRLIQHLRFFSNTEAGEVTMKDSAIKDADAFITMLHDFSAMGGAMRRVMTIALTNPQAYRNLTDYYTEEDQMPSEYMKKSRRLYVEALHSLPNPEPPDEYKDCPSLRQQLIHRTFLEELVFWTVKFEFPQKLVCLLLNMLTDPDYKDALTQAFVLHYSRISMMLEKSIDPDALSNRVVHVSVQLFSNEDLAYSMAIKLNLLHVMVFSLKFMMSKILMENTLLDEHKNFHFVVDCSKPIMKEHCYWPLVSDLNNVLSHKIVALKFMSDDGLLDMWFAFLSMFQGMNVNRRELFQHIEFEPNTYYAAFSAELEASAYPMWSMVSHLNDTALVEHSKKVLSHCLTALTDWFDAINFTEPSMNDIYKVSFHLPLHRYYAVFMCQAIKHQGLTLKEVLPPIDILHRMMMHPLQVQVSFYEILSGMWVRNGLQIKGQAMTYIQCNFCNSMVDADIYLLQICATQLAPAVFFNTVIDKFHVKKWLSMKSFCLHFANDGEYDNFMIESFLTFIATLMSIRLNLGASEVALTQLEMVTLLCMGDKTHSQLLELMPEKCGNYTGRDFENELSVVADYRAPNFEASGNMQQGMYSPKAHIWEQMYDPVHVLLRAVHRRDFQSSMDRFTEYARQNGKVKAGSTPWPPYRIPAPVSKEYEDPRKLLCSRVFHAIVFAFLHRSVKTGNVPEQTLSLAVFLLELAVEMAEPCQTDTQVCQTFRPEHKERIDGQFDAWYTSDWLSANLRTIIPTITITDQSTLQFLATDDNVESDSEMSEDAAPSSSCLMLSSPDEPHEEEMQIVVAGGPMRSNYLPVCENINSSSTGITQYPALPAPPTIAALLAGTEITTISIPTDGDVVLPGPSGYRDDYAPINRSYPTKLKTQRPACKVDFKVGESIISLLLRLHSTLSGGNNDSFELEHDPSSSTSSNLPHPSSESRVGDGAFFIGKVLHRISKLDPMCREAIIEAKERLWPQQKEEVDEEKEERDAREREERRRRAKERQQKLMAEFANRQKEFMEKTRENESGEMDWSECESISKLEYDCVICNQSTPSTEDKPMGLVVLLQASSILAHKRLNPESPILPTSDEELHNINESDCFAVEFDKRAHELYKEFDLPSWLLSINLGWEGGVHVQTCGHHLHLDCLKSYLNSLRNQQRHQNLAVDRGEYSCPLCRQLANSVLPLSPQLGECATVARTRPYNMASMTAELTLLLKENPPNAKTTNLTEAMDKSIHDMTNSTFLRYRQLFGTTSTQCVFLFVTSIARTNLEVEIVQRGGSLISPKSDDTAALALIPKRSSIVPLLHVLAMHARNLATWPTWPGWVQACGVNVNSSSNELTPYEREVPLLLRDPTALLTQFLLLLPLHLEQSYFSCVVKVLYNVLYFQSLTQLICSLPESWRAQWKNEGKYDLDTLEGCMALLVSSLEPGHIHIEEDGAVGGWAVDGKNHSKKQLEADVQAMCLPFLRIAGLIKHHLYGEELPEIRNEELEFVRLVYYLELVNEGMDWSRFNAAVALNWAWSELNDNNTTIVINTPEVLVTNWSNELLAFSYRSQSNKLIAQHYRWHQPRLLRLPSSYDKVFQYYHHKACTKCNSVPRETSVCLLCGSIVCLKETCCKANNVCEAVQHSIDCGAGTAMYLVVTSSLIIVIRGKRACLWGSVYLDSFGEEDRDLKRGKPLYLSQERYQLLENQWLSHRFDHINKKWVWHRDAL